MIRRIAFIFPGQGSQYKGIGSDLYHASAAARAVYDEASDALGFDIAELSFRDPDDAINLTRNTQPVLVAHHLACRAAFEEALGETITPIAAAGHSLGEYSALVAGGQIAFADAIRSVRRRGELMGEFGEGEMCAFLMKQEEIEPLAKQHCCAVAAINLPEQVVIGGRGDDLDALTASVAEHFPRKRSARLKTEGAFHTYYMVEAARRFREVLEALEINHGNDQTRVAANFSGDFHDEPQAIGSKLFFQLFHPVRWVDNINAVAALKPDVLIEFGGGLGDGEDPATKRPNLEGIIKKTFRGVENPPLYLPVINVATVQAAIEALTS
ncbi:ACP S-malonyltransferase [Gammaproteobacteria bacterium]|nr:ACP S-malonyltransferase [Gammaproteobacteria bacterium]